MISEIWQVFLLAMTPVGELRISIPVGLAVFRLDWLTVYLVSLAGNLVPVFFLLLFLSPISRYFSQKFEICQKLFSWFFKKTKENHLSKKVKYGYFALAVFVAIPLPITGGWTASIIAFLFGIPFKIAFLLIALGVGLAGAIVTSATLSGIALTKNFGWQVLVGIIMLGLITWLLYNRARNKKNKKVEEIKK